MAVCNRQEKRKRYLLIQYLGGEKKNLKSNSIWIYHLLIFQPLDVLACLLAPFQNWAFCHNLQSQFNGQGYPEKLNFVTKLLLVSWQSQLW